jgi:sulfate permease, SulP family
MHMRTSSGGGAVSRVGDVWGGLAAMLVALPSAIAFGLIIYSPLGADFAAQGAVVGILGTIAIGLVAPAFGGAPRLISAPCGPAAAVLAAFVVGLVGRDAAGAGHAYAPATVIVLLALLALIAGGLQVLFGLAGGGRIIKYIPYPVVAGYLSGVGVIIFLGQVPKLLGLAKGTHLWAGLAAPSLWKGPSVLVGVITIAVMVLAPKITRHVPAPILALGAGLLTYFALGGAHHELLTLADNSLVIGPIGGGGGFGWAEIAMRWSALGQLGVAEFQVVLVPAVTLAVLLSIDTLKTCVILDALTRSRHNSNRELVGQGLGNMASALAGGMPGAGTMGATLINLGSGGRTRLSSILEGVFALTAFVLIGRLVAWVPIAALAGILMVIAFRMVDRNVFQLLRQRSTVFDFLVVVAVVGTAVLFNLMAASGVGVGLAILLFLREQIRGSVVRRKTYGSQTHSRMRRLPEEMAVLEAQGSETVICELQGSLFFGTTDQLFTELANDLTSCRNVILDMRRVQTVDFTATHLLDQIEGRLAERQGLLILAHLPPSLPTGQDLRAYFDEIGLVKPSRSVRVFGEVDEALEWTENRLLETAGLRASGPETPLALHEIHLFKGIDAEVLAALTPCAEERSYQQGQTVFQHGDSGEEIYLIRCGSVRVVLPLRGGRQRHLATFGRGDFFGDMAFISPAARSADAVAATASEIFVISRARFDAVAMEHPVLDKKVFWRLARALALRLRQADAELRALEES